MDRKLFRVPRTRAAGQSSLLWPRKNYSKSITPFSYVIQFSIPKSHNTSRLQQETKNVHGCNYGKGTILLRHFSRKKAYSLTAVLR